MKTYGDLNLKAVREVEGLDFAHFTYLRGQCSCCYGPIDLPARYWSGEKPVEVVDENGIGHYERYGKPYDYSNACMYILFKNANNGSGIVTANDTIKDYTCVSYQLRGMEQVSRICELLQAQLGDDYVVVKPESDLTCIVIRTKEALGIN